MKSKKDLLDILIVCARQRKLIIFITLVFAVAAVAYSLLTPQIWRSTATFYVVDGQSQGLPFNLPGLGSLASSLLGGDKLQQAQDNINVMRSRMFSEKVIDRFQLLSYLKITESDSLKARDIALRKYKAKIIRIGLNEETGLISVAAETKSKQLSKDIADYYLVALEEYNQNFKVTKGKRNRIFLEKRVDEVYAAVDSLAEEMRQFQKKHKAVALETQLASLVELYATIIAEKMTTEVQLAMAKNLYAAQSPAVKELETKLKVILDNIAEIEKSSGSFKPKYLLDIDKIPDLSVRYAQIMLNLEIQKKVFEFLYPQFEAARLEELKDMPTLEILDHPRLAGLRVKPRRATTCIIVTFFGFLFSLALALVKDSIETREDKLTQLKQALYKK